jgi:hypothetical protein
MTRNWSKTIVAVMVVAGVFLSTNAFARTKMVEVADTPEQTYENMVSTNIWPWLVGFFNVGYERALGDSFSLRPRASYWSLSSSGNWALFALGIDAYFHPMGKGLEGWFLGPRYDAWILSVSDSGESGTGILHLLGAMAGYNWVFQGGFSLGVSLGAQTVLAGSVTSSSGTTTFDFPYRGFMPAFNVELGWAF